MIPDVRVSCVMLYVVAPGFWDCHPSALFCRPSHMTRSIVYCSGPSAQNTSPSIPHNPTLILPTGFEFPVLAALPEDLGHLDLSPANHQKPQHAFWNVMTLRFVNHARSHFIPEVVAQLPDRSK